MEVLKEGPNLRILTQITKSRDRERTGLIHNDPANVSGYTCVMNGEAGRGTALLGNSGRL